MLMGLVRQSGKFPIYILAEKNRYGYFRAWDCAARRCARGEWAGREAAILNENLNESSGNLSFYKCVVLFFTYIYFYMHFSIV